MSVRSMATSQRSAGQRAPTQAAQPSAQVVEAMKMAERLFETSNFLELREVICNATGLLEANTTAAC